MAQRVIHILPERVASQIAAGEVVERPASAVKELVENSIDAGARAISVEIEQGGCALIAVADDGCGMSSHDAIVSLRRHATSKIRDAADLAAIRTLGFRGEALAAIASVSRLVLKTRPADEVSGIQIGVSGGEEDDRRECAMAPGTRIIARDLFFNTPARLKFLKKPATEQGAVAEALQRLALAAPAIAFELYADGRKLLDLPRAATVMERLRQLFGARLAGAMLPMGGGGDGVKVEGLVSSSRESFPTARMIHTFVNGRAVRDRLLMRAVGNAYASLLPRGRYPAAALFITLSPREVDVNVHPMKAEVRFRRAGAVFETIYRALRDRLADQTAANAVAPGGNWPAEDGEQSGSEAASSAEPSRSAGNTDLPGPNDSSAHFVAADKSPEADSRPLKLMLDAQARPPALEQRPLELSWRAPSQCELPAPPGPAGRTVGAGAAPNYSELRVMGQLFAGYVVLEDSDGLLLVDQHAAHERVTFERLKAELARGAVTTQASLIPQTMELNPARAAYVHGALPKLRALGFDLEPFGPATIVLKGTPAVFGAEGGLGLLSDMIDTLSEVEADSAEGFETLLKQLACHGSVRVGRVLRLPEIQALLTDLDRTPFKTNCPHGRPVHIRFPRGQIERMFRR